MTAPDVLDEIGEVLDEIFRYVGQPPEYGRSCDYREHVTIIAYYSL